MKTRVGTDWLLLTCACVITISLIVWHERQPIARQSPAEQNQVFVELADRAAAMREKDIQEIARLMLLAEQWRVVAEQNQNGFDEMERVALRWKSQARRWQRVAKQRASAPSPEQRSVQSLAAPQAAIAIGGTALPGGTKWEFCPTSCSPPTGLVSGLTAFSLTNGNVRFGAEVRGGMWSWIKTVAVTCTQAQMADAADKFVCQAPVGSEIFRGPRVRPKSTASAVLALDVAVDSSFAHCPMRLPDSSYTAEEREQCRKLDVLAAAMRGPDVEEER